mmetsp:Transcript_97763/g.254977  ORF Transcript_97763/g.254977 Transcript_97763/m.254977 type:complete len:215 (+) Transcript_97763:512-1156(+)
MQLCQCCQRTWGHWRSPQPSKVARQVVVVAAMAWLLRARSRLIRTMNSKSRIGRRRHRPRMRRECRRCQCRLSGRPACGRPSLERSLRSPVRLLLPLPRLLLSPPRPRACSRGRGHGHTRGPPLSPLRLLQRSLALQNRGRRHRSSALDHVLPRQRVLQFRQCTARGEMAGKAPRMGCLATSDWPHRRGPRRPHPLRPQSPQQHQSQPKLPRLH